MFVVGDAHQRIYDNHVSLARVGVDVRGRSKRLTVNYRTTQEILTLAVPALGKASVTGLDDEADTLIGYRGLGRMPSGSALCTECRASSSRPSRSSALRMGRCPRRQR